LPLGDCKFQISFGILTRKYDIADPWNQQVHGSKEMPSRKTDLRKLPGKGYSHQNTLG
jgi:hypothetical protein